MISIWKPHCHLIKTIDKLLTMHNDMNCSNYKALFSQIVFKKEGWNQKASILLKLSVIYANGRVEQVI